MIFMMMKIKCNFVCVFISHDQSCVDNDDLKTVIYMIMMNDDDGNTDYDYDYDNDERGECVQHMMLQYLQHDAQFPNSNN